MNKKIAGKHRIGPHNIDVISTFVGNLLGDSYGEKRYKSSRFILNVSVKNIDYICSLHRFYNKRGYTSEKPLKKTKIIGKGGKIYYSVRMRTYSFSSLNWLYDLFYPPINPDKMCKKNKIFKKRVPKCIEDFLTPRAFAIWFMDDGSRSGSGCRISTNSFCIEDIELLKETISTRYGFKPSIQKQGGYFLLYIYKKDLPLLSQIVKPHMVESMFYKLNGY